MEDEIQQVARALQVDMLWGWLGCSRSQWLLTGCWQQGRTDLWLDDPAAFKVHYYQVARLEPSSAPFPSKLRAPCARRRRSRTVGPAEGLLCDPGQWQVLFGLASQCHSSKLQRVLRPEGGLAAAIEAMTGFRAGARKLSFTWHRRYITRFPIVEDGYLTRLVKTVKCASSAANLALCWRTAASDEGWSSLTPVWKAQKMVSVSEQLWISKPC